MKGLARITSAIVPPAALLLLCSCGGSGSESYGSNSPPTESSISITGPAEQSFRNAVTMLYKPRSIWYLSVNATDRRTYRTAATLAFHPDFIPSVGTFPVEPLGDLERPIVYGVIEYAPILGTMENTKNFSENSKGTLEFTSIDPVVEGNFQYEAATEDGETATVTGKFKADRPAEWSQ